MHARAASIVLLALGSTLAACAPTGQEDGNAEKTIDDADAVKECAAGTTVKGIDVSYYQGKIDWAAVKKGGISFAIARTSDGSTYKDSRFIENWKGMKAAGLVRGTYLFFRPGQDPTAQADLLISQVKAAGGMEAGDLAPTVDVEVTDGVGTSTIISRMKTVLSKLQSAFGKTPTIYTAPGFWNQFGKPAGFDKYTLWVANWGVSCPGLPTSWSHWHFWQSADNGSVSGISGAVDIDHFNGSLADLKAFAGGANPPPGGDSGGGLPSLGGATTGDPAIASNADGRLEIFATGSSHHVVTAFQTAPNGGWSGWFDLGGSLAGTPTVGTNADGRLEIFARGTDHAIWHAWQDGPNGKVGAWASMDGDVEADPVVARNSDGRLEVFVAGGDGWMYHATQSKPGSTFSKWSVVSNFVTGGLEDPRPVLRKNGRIALIARGSKDGTTYLSNQDGTGGWSAWKSLGGTLSSAPASAQNLDGRLEVFGRGSDGALWHNYEISPSGNWSGWASLGGGVYEPVVAADKDGRLEVFVRGNNKDLYRNNQTAPNSGWTGWINMKGAMQGAAAVGRNADGRLEVFIQADDGSVGHAWQASAGKW